MTGHTKEPWEVFVSCEVTADDPTGQFSHALIFETYNSPNPREDANRIVACVNALATIPDPQAFMEAARGMHRLAQNFRDMLEAHCDNIGEHLCTEDQALFDGWKAELAAFDATLGEQ